MEVKIEALRASYGDCLFVTIADGDKPFIIMIDGGTATTYSHKGGKGKTLSGPLKQKLDALKEQGLAIDLMILTHVDDDHIGGVIRWFENDMPTGSFVKRIWMNDDVEINVGAGLENNSAQAASLKKRLMDNGISFENQKMKGYEENFEWGRILLLAPTEIQHNRIARNIACGLENAVSTRYDVDIKTLIQEEYFCDKASPENDASIALLLQTNDGENNLFLGDANIDTVISSLTGIEGLEPPIHCKWVKLSHHGSKNNFKPELLNLIDSENFIFSTDGTRYGHPDKEVVAWIVDRTQSKLWFNYSERAEQIFTQQDMLDYTGLDERIKVF